MQEQFSYEDENGNETRIWIHKDTGDLHIMKKYGEETVIPFEVGVKIIDLIFAKQENFRESVKTSWVKNLGF